MEARKFKATDLKAPKFGFVYYPGKWNWSGSEQYRHPQICIYKMYGPAGMYDTSVMDITFQMDKGKPYAYAMAFEKSRTHQIHRVMQGLNALKIPRMERREQGPGLANLLVPRRFRGRETAFIQARELVEAQA